MIYGIMYTRNTHNFPSFDSLCKLKINIMHMKHRTEKFPTLFLIIVARRAAKELIFCVPSMIDVFSNVLFSGSYIQSPEFISLHVLMDARLTKGHLTSFQPTNIFIVFKDRAYYTKVLLTHKICIFRHFQTKWAGAFLFSHDIVWIFIKFIKCYELWVKHILCNVYIMYALDMAHEKFDIWIDVDLLNHQVCFLSNWG